MRSNQTFSGLFLAVLLLSPFGALAEEVPPVRADLNYASRYVFRGLERAGGSTQATWEMSRDKLRGGLWASLPVNGGETREVNLNAAYVWSVGDELTLETSARVYWLGGQAAESVEHSYEAGLVATLVSVNGFTPSFAYYHDFRLRADTVQASVAHSIALTRIGAFVDLNFFAGWGTGADWRPDTPGPRRRDSYGYWGAEAHLPYRVGPHSTVIVGLHYADAIGRSVANGPFSLADRENFWVTLGVNLDF